MLGALAACGGGGSPTASQSRARHPPTTDAAVETTAPSTSSSVAAVPAAPPTYPTGASIVPTTCPAEVIPRGVENPSGQSSPVTQEIIVHPYPIHGTTAADLRAQMNECGIRDGGITVDGRTNWYVSWNFGLDGSSGCHVTWTKVHVLVDMYLPQWEEASGSAIEPQWNRYLTALIDHEGGHMQHGIDAANETASAISSLPPAATCDEMDTQANQAGQRVLAAFNQQDVAYDDETGHGRTQGAVFP